MKLLCVHQIHLLFIGVFFFIQTPKSFSEKYSNTISTSSEFNGSTVRAHAFDAVWTLALVLNYTEEMRWQNQMKEHAIHENCRSNLTGDLVPLNEFNYTNAYMGCVMKHNFYKVNFTGVSVSIEKYSVLICVHTSKACTIATTNIVHRTIQVYMWSIQYPEPCHGVLSLQLSIENTK